MSGTPDRFRHENDVNPGEGLDAFAVESLTPKTKAAKLRLAAVTKWFQKPRLAKLRINLVNTRLRRNRRAQVPVTPPPTTPTPPSGPPPSNHGLPGRVQAEWILVGIVSLALAAWLVRSTSDFNWPLIGWVVLSIVVGIPLVIFLGWLLALLGRGIRRIFFGRRNKDGNESPTRPVDRTIVSTSNFKNTPLWNFLKAAALIVLVGFVVVWTYEELLNVYKRSGLAGLGRVQAATVVLPSASGGSKLPFELATPIADCESGLRDDKGQPIPGSARQFDENNNVITNKNTDGTVDYGKWQINSSHKDEWTKRGINIMTEAGNEEFARILFERNGFRDWNSSRGCWQQILLGNTSSVQTLVLRPKEPGTVSVPVGWRWDIQKPKPIPSNWTRRDNGTFNAQGNRIEVFEIVSPATEVTLNIAISRCLTPQDCAW